VASVSLRWTGTCALATDRDELLSYIKRLAEMNDALLTTKLPESRDPFLEMMTAKRAEGLKPRNNIEVLDQDIKGKIVINAKLFADQREFEEKVAQLRVPVVDHVGADARESAFVINLSTPQSRFVRFDSAHITGVNFRIYDPCQLYPGEDRVSFVFLYCPDAPFLDGCICEAFHHIESPGMIDFAALGAADWYLRSPEIHLRYYLEEWFDLLLSWVKFFFVPNLHWWRWGDSPGYANFHRQFEELQRIVGTAAAKTESFDKLVEAFLLAAANTYAETAEIAAQPGIKP
jgi:hypothetical protein